MGNMLDAIFYGLLGAAKEISESSDYTDKEEGDYRASDYVVKYGAKTYDTIRENAEKLQK